MHTCYRESDVGDSSRVGKRSGQWNHQNAFFLKSPLVKGLRLSGGRFDEALRLTRRAVDLDPLNAMSWEILGETKFCSGKADDAIGDFKRAVELNPDLWDGHLFLSKIYILQGRPQDALPEIERVPVDSIRLPLYAIAYHALGRKKESDAALSELIAKYHRGSEYLIAQVYAFREESNEAFKWLDRAYAMHNDA